MLVSHQHSRRTRRSVTAITLVLALVAGVLAAMPAAMAATSNISIFVKELGTATTVGDFEWLINEDNAKLAGSANIPSLTGTESYSPVVATGDASNASGITLENGRYLISVDAPGYKLWGKHVALPGDAGTVTIEVSPEPLPLATLQVHVFHDNAMVNGANDGPITGPDGNFEEGLAGFELILEDGTGEVTVDHFGNPLCGGSCTSDANGDIVVPNLAPNKYEVMVSPPDDPDTPYVDWIQTTTIEGTHVIDAWLEEGSEGVAAEEGFRTAPAASWLAWPDRDRGGLARPSTGLHLR